MVWCPLIQVTRCEPLACLVQRQHLVGVAVEDQYTAQMLHVWVVPYPGGVFSDDLSAAATNAAVQAVLAEHS